MKATTGTNALIFEGQLDEMTSISHLVEAFEAIKRQGFKEPLILDLSNVSRGNSAGILTWLRFLKQIKTKSKYVNAPLWLVGQFNMITGYFEAESYVEGFQAPLFDPVSETSKVVTLKVGLDVPVLESYSDFSMNNTKIDGVEYEVDFVPEQYFSFISENFQIFKNQIK